MKKLIAIISKNRIISARLLLSALLEFGQCADKDRPTYPCFLGVGWGWGSD